MKRIHILATGLLLIASLGGASLRPQPEAEYPQADASDVGSIDAIMSAWYASLSGEAGEARHDDGR